MFIANDYSSFGGSASVGKDIALRPVPKHSAEKLYLSRLEELTRATAVSFQNYQTAVEQRRRSEEARRWEIGELHKALDGLFGMPACL